MKQAIRDYEADKSHIIGVNDGYMSRAHWNLLCSIRDMRLWCRGIKPHRFWKVTHVKEYFGVRGNKQSVLDQLLKMQENINREAIKQQIKKELGI